MKEKARLGRDEQRFQGRPLLPPPLDRSPSLHLLLFLYGFFIDPISMNPNPFPPSCFSLHLRTLHSLPDSCIPRTTKTMLLIDAAPRGFLLPPCSLRLLSPWLRAKPASSRSTKLSLCFGDPPETVSTLLEAAPTRAYSPTTVCASHFGQE